VVAVEDLAAWSVLDGSRWSIRCSRVPEPEQDGSSRMAFTWSGKEGKLVRGGAAI
jgi:hypothetical protein